MKPRLVPFAVAAMLALAPSLHTRAAAGAGAASPSHVYAIRDAKVVTLAGLPVEHGTVVIRDGKIAAVGASVDVPADAQVIDGKGLEVYPRSL